MNNLTEKFKEMKRIVAEKGSKKYAIGAVAVTVMVAALSVFTMSTSYSLEIDGKVVGQVDSKAVVTEALNDAKVAAEEASGLDIVAAYNSVEVKAVHSFQKATLTNEEVLAVITPTDSTISIEFLSESNIVSGTYRAVVVG